MLKTLNWVPGVHDKVPQMIGGAMPLLNPRWNTDDCSITESMHQVSRQKKGNSPYFVTMLCAGYFHNEIMTKTTGIKNVKKKHAQNKYS